MRHTVSIPLTVFWTILIAACGTTKSFSPGPVIKDPDNEFPQVDLPLLLDPTGSSPGIDAAFHAFNNSTPTIGKRNDVQERILAASVARCGEYKAYLKSLDARTNFYLGSLTTTLAGAGAIFTAASTTRALAGTAAITSGVQSQFNENYFAEQATQVISAGIDARRRQLYEAIRMRQSESIDAYPVAAAVKDAVEFHNACSLLAGLTKAGESIERVQNPGVEDLQRLRDVQVTFEGTFGDDENTELLKEWLGWDGEAYANEANLTALTEWKDTEGLNDIFITTLLNAKKFSVTRAKAVRELLPEEASN